MQNIGTHTLSNQATAVSGLLVAELASKQVANIVQIMVQLGHTEKNAASGRLDVAGLTFGS